MLTAQEALIQLQEGNQRFVEGKSTYNTSDTRRRNELVDGQKPFAIILGCSDSRVPSWKPRLSLIRDLGIYL